MLSEAAREHLRRIAAAAVRAAARGEEPPADASGCDIPGLDTPCGAFVTLKAAGRLRGCIGTLRSARPVRETVLQMAVAAARRDPRFPPVEPDEVDGLTVEISLLSPFERVDDLATIEVGRDGLYVVQGLSSGLLLPQVPVEQGWDRETFIERTCEKAGLSRRAWADHATEMWRFTAEVF